MPDVFISIKTERRDRAQSASPFAGYAVALLPSTTVPAVSASPTREFFGIPAGTYTVSVQNVAADGSPIGEPSTGQLVVPAPTPEPSMVSYQHAVGFEALIK
jgi:hypothetical protein